MSFKSHFRRKREGDTLRNSVKNFFGNCTGIHFTITLETVSKIPLGTLLSQFEIIRLDVSQKNSLEFQKLRIEIS